MLGQERIYVGEVETTLGVITLASTKKGICWVSFSSGERAIGELGHWADNFFVSKQVVRDELALKQAKQQLEEYLAGKRKQFTLPLDIRGTPFQKRVWQALLEIPYGQVRSYKEIAKAIKAPQAVRAVGGANNKNSLPIFVPCHRVIGSSGSLVGYRAGLTIKRKLLELEGVNLLSLRRTNG